MPLDATSPPFPPTSALRRIGNLAARGWRMKLYALAVEAAALRTEDLTAAGRVFRALLAQPDMAAVAGFAVLRAGASPGSLSLSAYWWEGNVLNRAVRVLPGCGGAPQRPGDAACMGDVDTLLLMAREAAAWRRCTEGPGLSSLDAYLAECCA